MEVSARFDDERGNAARIRAYVLTNFAGLRAGYVVLGLDDLEALESFDVRAAA